MKRIAAVLVLAILASVAGFVRPAQGAAGSDSNAGPLLRWHWAGRSALLQATNATSLKQIDALPITDELRSLIATNLARAALRFWQTNGRLSADAVDPTPWLQPLCRDFLTAETFLDVRGPVGRSETALAIALSDIRARLWNTNLWQLTEAWKLGSPRVVTNAGFAGWEIRKSSAPNLLQFFQAGQWVVVGLGQNPPVASLLEQISQKQRPLPALNGPLLDLEANLTALQKWVPLLAAFPLPPARLTVTGRGENLRTEVRLQYPGPVPVTFEPWQLPTNLVSEPLSSFTAARGIRHWLERVQGLKKLGLQPLPNQFCAWGITNEICRVYFTVPVADATNAINHLALTAPQYAYDRLGRPLGEFVYRSNRAEVLWTGLPFIQPFLRAARGPATGFVLGGVFFLLPKVYPPPPELYAQIAGRTNLLYYDWELSDTRLDHSKQLYDLIHIAAGRRPVGPTNTLSRRWLMAVSGKLHDSVTEIAQSGPQELSLVRKSSIGLTGFELATLSAWLDSPGFPYSIDPPPLLAFARSTNRSNTLPARSIPAPKP